MFAAARRYAELNSTSIEDLEFHTDSISRVLTSVPGSAGCEVIETRVLTHAATATPAEGGRS
jgi:hypothetical protein